MVEWLVYFCLQRRRKYTVVYLDKSDGYEIQILYFDSFLIYNRMALYGL